MSSSAKSLRSKSAKDLVKLEAELTEDITEFARDRVMSKAEKDVFKMKKMKRELARVKTLLKELQNSESGDKK